MMMKWLATAIRHGLLRVAAFFGVQPVKVAALALLAGVAGASVCPAAENIGAAARGPFIQVDWQVDWQGPMSLPRRYRNHCSYDVVHGRYYCSDHCGLDYQFSYCSRESFGCCHLGLGYCDWNGILRCRP
jgi:hypothetical protein